MRRAYRNRVAKILVVKVLVLLFGVQPLAAVSSDLVVSGAVLLCCAEHRASRRAEVARHLISLRHHRHYLNLTREGDAAMGEQRYWLVFYSLYQ